MALVNPNIAMSFRQPEFKPRNAMAEYAQMQQIQSGQRQAEVADMQIQRMRQEDQEVERLHQIAMKHGGPDSRMEMGKALLASRNAAQRELGFKIIRHEEAVRAYNSEFGPGAMAAPIMPSSAPNAMVAPAELAAGAQPEPMTPVPGVISTSRVPGITTAPITAPTGTMREIAPGGGMGAEMPLAQANTLAPPAAAPVNAMLAAQPTAPTAPNIDALRRQYGMAVAAGRSDAPVLLKQIEAALRGDQNRPMAVSPGQVVIDPRTGQQIFNAPGKTTLSDRFVPVGRLVFDRETRQYISPSQAQLAQSQERPATAARVAENAAPRKPMTELQQQAFRKGMAADKTGVKASQSVVNELEKLTDELVGNPEKKIAPHPGLSGITGIQAMLPSLPESLVTSGNARKAQQRLETLKGKVMAFGRQLASLEGKLGNMAVQEWKFVSDSIQAIDPAAGNLDVQLRDIVRQAKNFANTVQERYDLTYEADGAPAEPTAAPTATPPRAGGNAPAAGGLSPAEQAELDQLRKRFRK
jgi:hypothetical protein